jgi:hypothetical protein
MRFASGPKSGRIKRCSGKEVEPVAPTFLSAGWEAFEPPVPNRSVARERNLGRDTRLESLVTCRLERRFTSTCPRLNLFHRPRGMFADQWLVIVHGIL